MYNETLKNKFISSYTQNLNTAKAAVSIFSALAPFEENIWHADLCTVSHELLQEALDKGLSLQTRSKWQKLGILRDYVKWCIASGVPNACDAIQHVNTLALDKVRHQMVASPLMLQEYLDNIFLPEAELTVDNTYRCYLWLAFGGLFAQDTFQVTGDEVDFSTMRVTHDGISAPIYREGLPAFRNAVELSEFRYVHSNYANTITKPRLSGNLIMRGISSVPSISTMRSLLSHRTAEYREILHLTYERIWLSGIFYRTYELERAGVPVSFAEVVERTTPDGKLSEKNTKMKAHMEDYQRWKVAFSV